MCNLRMQGVRGAIVAEENSPEAILSATRELLQAILQANPSLRPQDLASVIFTVTEDLNATYPALAARQIGWLQVPLICMREIPVPGELSGCVRILMHWNTDLRQDQIRHVYLRQAVQLRPDLNPQIIPAMQEAVR